MREAWENVEAMLGRMQFLLLESGIPMRQVQMPLVRYSTDVEGSFQFRPKPADEIKLEQYVEAFDWLHRLYTGGAWLGVERAKKLRTQEIWDTYKAHGFRGMQEQIILERAQLALRKAWKTNRPSFFGRVYREPEQDSDQENSDGGGVRSEEAGTDESDS